MSLHAHEQATTSPRGHDLEEDGVGDRSDSQTTLDKYYATESDRRDSLRSESPGPVPSRTRGKTARASRKALDRVSDSGDEREDRNADSDVAEDGSPHRRRPTCPTARQSLTNAILHVGPSISD